MGIWEDWLDSLSSQELKKIYRALKDRKGYRELKRFLERLEKKMNEKMKVVMLLSGGMDSVSCLYHVNLEHNVVGTISFDYGALHNWKELPCALYHSQKLDIPHRVIPLRFIAELWRSALVGSVDIPEGHYEENTMKSTVVPFRNGIMLSIATGYAESIEAQGLAIAAHAGDHAIYPDCREEFMVQMGLAMRLGTYAKINLLRPFIRLTKADIASRGYELGVDFAETWSCYKGGHIHCGKCGTCVERREAFMLAGLDDPTKYESKEAIPPRPTSVVYPHPPMVS